MHLTTCPSHMPLPLAPPTCPSHMPTWTSTHKVHRILYTFSLYQTSYVVLSHYHWSQSLENRTTTIIMATVNYCMQTGAAVRITHTLSWMRQDWGPMRKGLTHKTQGSRYETPNCRTGKMARRNWKAACCKVLVLVASCVVLAVAIAGLSVLRRDFAEVWKELRELTCCNVAQCLTRGMRFSKARQCINNICVSKVI